MVFNEDLIDGFVKFEGRRICDKSTQRTAGGQKINTTKILTDKGEEWTFEGFDELTVRKNGMIISSNKAIGRAWQNYVISKTFGAQRTTLLNKFINASRQSFTDVHTVLCEFEPVKTIETFGDNRLKHLLGLEEKKFSSELDKAHTIEDFICLRERVQMDRIYYGQMVESSINAILAQIPRGYNENGELVYNFTEHNFEYYTRVKTIGETIDSAFRYQIYRADQKEQEKEME